MTEIRGYDEDCVWRGEVRRQNLTEMALILEPDGTDKDRNDLDIFPDALLELNTHETLASERYLLTLRIPCERTASAFRYCVHLDQ